MKKKLGLFDNISSCGIAFTHIIYVNKRFAFLLNFFFFTEILFSASDRFLAVFRYGVWFFSSIFFLFFLIFFVQTRSKRKVRISFLFVSCFFLYFDKLRSEREEKRREKQNAPCFYKICCFSVKKWCVCVLFIFFLLFTITVKQTNICIKLYNQQCGAKTIITNL